MHPSVIASRWIRDRGAWTCSSGTVSLHAVTVAGVKSVSEEGEDSKRRLIASVVFTDAKFREIQQLF